MRQYSFERLQAEYAALWTTMRVTKPNEASRQARQIIAHKDRYKAVEARTSVPWFVIGCLHMRESNANFATWLHNGDPMRDRDGDPVQTVHRPEHRPPNPDCSWEDGAYDALVVVEHLDEIKVWNPARVAYASEVYNGFGYRAPDKNIPSPYLWGGTSIQKPGKYIHDGPSGWRPKVMDDQIGSMAVLQMLLTIDPDARFENPDAPPPAPAAIAAAEMEPPLSPKAEETSSQVKPLRKSKSIWGAVLGFLTTAGSTVMGFLDKLNNPYTLAAFVAVLGVAGIALYLVVKGRIDVGKIVDHLSGDDEVEQIS